MARMKTRRRRPGVSGSTKTSVEVLLARDVPNLGLGGDIVRVKPGFARNYLLPQGLATVATEANKRQIETFKVKLQDLEKQRVKDLKVMADKIANYSVTLEANANEEGQLYGSISAADISAALKTADYPVEAEMIEMDGPLKLLGMYTIPLKLTKDVESEVKVWVVPSASAAK